MGNQEWTIQRNWPYWLYKSQDEEKHKYKHNTIRVEHQYA